MEDDPQKREIKNRRNFSFRLNLFFFVTFFVFSVLIVRLAILQFVEGPSLRDEETRRGHTDVLIPPIRGNIYDSSEHALAYSTSTQTLTYSIEPGTKKADSIATAKKLFDVFQKNGDPNVAISLADIIKNMDLDYKKNTVTVPRRIKSGLSSKEIAYFMENEALYPGIDIVEESIRHYDKSTLAVQLVGYLKKYGGGAENNLYKDRVKTQDPRLKYLQQEDVGYDGIEYMYQDILRGKNGLKTYPVNAASRIIGPPVITKPEKGDNLYLTINRDVQAKTQQAIMDQLHLLRTTSDRSIRQDNAKTGYAVAMEVKTGKVVAMASMPDYDPNIWEGGKISTDDYNSIANVLQNGTISSVIGPYTDPKEQRKHPSSVVFLGSTMKPLSILIGLNENLFTTSSTWNDTGAFYYGKEGSSTRRKIGNAKGHAYGLLDPALAITRSSNPFMAKMVGNALYLKDGSKGVDVWDNYVKQFGLGVSTGSGLPNESKGVIGYFHEREAASSQSALIFASFGQMGRYTTLQLAQYTATLASHGKRMKPQFVNEVKDSDGNIVQSFKPEVLNSITFPDNYWKEIELGMANVKVNAFDGASYKVLRKTGTSEQQVSGKTVDNAVFIAYAPAQDPVLAVAVVVPEGGFGANGAAPIARKIFDAYDDAIGLNGVPKKPVSSTGTAGTDATAAGTTGTTGTTGTIGTGAKGTGTTGTGTP
ncbi:penicillin-binding protein 2 [Paenibacillus baekrokdamisoli]|uniref:Penicillin-binding protein 2 n=1 Tax=Paenibacillus baekrokdamisoli TaxID=1712516 RepID=A0A3G9J7C1_9BACL|nr:penicillin-binding transpeptidase domain-containing protein [Paenibacillus baekrokdamisoli]MBB3071265.1 penicillin-binding protein 2 [Paenibacillus baekrokdamisoli]BBH21681.1 penicillin-binding protein 2 [Paenibacillus baekrokdamisoli]